jgi:hypothetical protein
MDEKYDELICPYDIDSNSIIDDELRELFSGIPAGVRMTVILDNCFSGSGTKAPAFMDLRPRFLPPSVRGKPELLNPFAAKPKSKDLFPQEGMNELLLSGCRDNEFSYDANFGGIFHGAMTYNAMDVILKAKYKVTYEQLHRRINLRLTKGNINQHPQLEGKKTFKSQISHNVGWLRQVRLSYPGLASIDHLFQAGATWPGESLILVSIHEEPVFLAAKRLYQYRNERFWCRRQMILPLEHNEDDTKGALKQPQMGRFSSTRLLGKPGEQFYNSSLPRFC